MDNKKIYLVRPNGGYEQLTPEEAVVHLAAENDKLRAQLTSGPYASVAKQACANLAAKVEHAIAVDELQHEVARLQGLLHESEKAVAAFQTRALVAETRCFDLTVEVDLRTKALDGRQLLIDQLRYELSCASDTMRRQATELAYVGK